MDTTDDFGWWIRRLGLLAPSVAAEKTPGPQRTSQAPHHSLTTSQHLLSSRRQRRPKHASLEGLPRLPWLLSRRLIPAVPRSLLAMPRRGGAARGCRPSREAAADRARRHATYSHRLTVLGLTLGVLSQAHRPRRHARACAAAVSSSEYPCAAPSSNSRPTQLFSRPSVGDLRCKTSPHGSRGFVGGGFRVVAYFSRFAVKQLGPAPVEGPGELPGREG